LKTTPSKSLKVKNLQNLDCIISKCDLENTSNEDTKSSDDSTKEDNSNEGKESRGDVGKKECREDISNEGKETSKTLDCNDDVEFFSTSEEENLGIVCIEKIDYYPMEKVEEKLLELKEKVERSLDEYSSNHYYIDYSYLLDNTKKFLKKIQNHILKLKEMLKEQKESNKTQVEENKEETTRIKNEKEEREVDDEIGKSLETIIHLKTQIEEDKG
jgi:hypothetical protein